MDTWLEIVEFKWDARIAGLQRTLRMRVDGVPLIRVCTVVSGATPRRTVARDVKEAAHDLIKE